MVAQTLRFRLPSLNNSVRPPALRPSAGWKIPVKGRCQGRGKEDLPLPRVALSMKSPFCVAVSGPAPCLTQCGAALRGRGAGILPPYTPLQDRVRHGKNEQILDTDRPCPL